MAVDLYRKLYRKLDRSLAVSVRLGMADKVNDEVNDKDGHIGLVDSLVDVIVRCRFFLSPPFHISVLHIFVRNTPLRRCRQKHRPSSAVRPLAFPVWRMMTLESTTDGDRWERWEAGWEVRVAQR